MRHLTFLSLVLLFITLCFSCSNSKNDLEFNGENTGSPEYINCVRDCDFDDECIDECMKEINLKDFREGSITYKVEYFNTDNPAVATKVAAMPDSVVMYFKNDITKFLLEGYIFTFSVLADNKKMKQTVSAQVVASKLKTELNTQEVLKENKENQPKVDIDITDNIKSICGYNCREINVKPEDENIKEFKVYYTSEIPLKNTNWNNIYSVLPGVLLEYEAFLNDMHIRLTAVRVDYKKIDPEEFKVSKKFKKVELQRIKDLIDFF